MFDNRKKSFWKENLIKVIEWLIIQILTVFLFRFSCDLLGFLMNTKACNLWSKMKIMRSYLHKETCKKHSIKRLMVISIMSNIFSKINKNQTHLLSITTNTLIYDHMYRPTYMHAVQGSKLDQSYFKNENIYKIYWSIYLEGLFKQHP